MPSTTVKSTVTGPLKLAAWVMVQVPSPLSTTVPKDVVRLPIDSVSPSESE
ncbi:hypothetical protein WBG79_24610 [Prosthecomicrobium sp. N25]